ncbi:hypothetical protein GN958_ATG08640 [Phytophthora infestans]|uniref:Uncharacterized protein n=1 Tax=Phytophthora infestans TaxID=4787 RepID=A0A8S9UT22_PHYIN|nr:hypothetical protein GN958_ATG08640 [Phytophthora infestans]
MCFTYHVLKAIAPSTDVNGLLAALTKTQAAESAELLRCAAPVRQSRFTVPPLTASLAALHYPSPTAALCSIALVCRVTPPRYLCSASGAAP